MIYIIYIIMGNSISKVVFSKKMKKVVENFRKSFIIVKKWNYKNE